MQLKGGCLCGAVTFNLQGDASSFYVCHCSRCQKSTGSAYASNLFVRNAKLAWDKGKDKCVDYQHAGTRFGKRFCTHCASPLPRVIDEKNNVIQLPAGSLDGDQDFEPTAHIFTEDKKCWEDKLSQTKQWPGLPA